MNKLINRKMILYFCAVLSLFCICSCGRANQDSVYGVYTADYDIAKEILTLNKEGTFKQEVLLKSNSKTDTQSGAWSYDKKTGYITFKERFMYVKDGYNKFNENYATPEKGVTVLPVVNYLGNIRIEVYENEAYKKVK